MAQDTFLSRFINKEQERVARASSLLLIYEQQAYERRARLLDSIKK